MFMVCVATGAACGLLYPRLGRSQFFEGFFLPMSAGYILILPVALGALTVALAPPESRQSWLFRIFAPWTSLMICLLTALAVGWEGSIWLAMAAVVTGPLVTMIGLLAALAIGWEGSISLVMAAVVMGPLATFGGIVVGLVSTPRFGIGANPRRSSRLGGCRGRAGIHWNSRRDSG